MLLRLAWRSLLRHKRRTIITGAGVAISLAMGLIFIGINDDGHARMAELGIRMGAGHVLVQGQGYQETQTLDHLVRRPAAVAALARSLPAVSEAAPRVHVSGLLSTGESSSPVLVAGVDPRREARLSDIPAPRRRRAGAYLRTRRELPFANQPADLYLGAELARTLDLQVGDRTVLTVSPPDAARPASAAYLVRGIFKTGVTELDQGWVEVPIAELQAQLGLGDQATQVAVLARSLGDTAAIAAALRQRLPRGDRLEVLPWQEALRELHEAIVLDEGSGYLMMAIIFIIVALGIFNTVLMSVVERTREFGVMMALGTRPGQLFAVVLLEALLLACLAAALGIALGLGLHALVAARGIDIAAMAGDYQISGIVMEGRIYSLLTVGTVARWSATVIGLTLLSALYPALRASRLRPVEAIRHV